MALGCYESKEKIGVAMCDNKLTLSDYYDAKDRIRELEKERDNLINNLKKVNYNGSLIDLPLKFAELKKQLEEKSK
jgi:predicted nuclease with TOPRIM domain